MFMVRGNRGLVCPLQLHDLLIVAVDPLIQLLNLPVIRGNLGPQNLNLPVLLCHRVLELRLHGQNTGFARLSLLNPSAELGNSPVLL